ncbi:condensation domain-containing protein, partial [Nocardia brasiliensis]|uniref:condensation domain-containing protein n=1 Tax=Nocardia brasiliensis TaxID=37326 RepID=UPI002456E0EC
MMIPLSAGQYRLWFLDQLEGPNATYNMPVVLGLSGELDVAALGSALGDVVARHESLRTVIEVVDGEPWQRVVQDVVPVFEVVDIAQSQLQEQLDRVVAHHFDLSVEIPIRARVFQLGPREFVLALVMHHLAGDGWSFAPLMRDLSAAYAARAAGVVPRFTPLPVQYADYALWQREMLGELDDPGSEIAVQLGYWRRVLEGMPQELALPYDRARPVVASHRGAVVPLVIDAGVYRRLRKVARDNGVTVFMVLNAVSAVLLCGVGAGHDIPMGAALAGRDEQALEDLVGFFVNTVVLRTDLSGNPDFTEVLGRVREAHLGAHAHAGVPFERVVEAVGTQRSASRHPLFQVMLVLQNNARAELTLPHITTSQTTANTGTAKFDLTFAFTETLATDGTIDGLAGSIEYATYLFDHDTITTLAQRFTRLLDTLVSAPHTTISALTLLTPHEQQLLLHD